MRFKSLIILTLILLPIALAGNVTIQGTMNDTFIRSTAGDTNYGTLSAMNVQDYTNIQRGFVFIDLSSYSNLTGATISSASLNMYAYGYGGSPKVQFEWTWCNTSYFPEQTVTWNNQGTYTGTCSANALGSVATPTAISLNDLNITNAVTKSLTGTKKFLIRIKYISEAGTNNYLQYRTKEHTTTNQKPQVQITFSTTVDPCAYTSGNKTFESNCTITSNLATSQNTIKVNGKNTVKINGAYNLK